MKNDDLVCPICGEPTSVYMGNARKDRLCRKHANMFKNGEIVQCPDCHSWHEAGVACKCKSQGPEPERTQPERSERKIPWARSETVIYECPKCGKYHKVGETCDNVEQKIKSTEASSNDELTCIICGEPSNGKHFCLKCYHTYKNKVLYLQVKQCKEFTKLDAEYESELVCDDGHMVKSPYEKIIDNWLFSENIKHAYEKKIDISETQDITPDFFIPEYEGTKNIYIEFWGYGEENKKYTQIKEYKQKIYPELIKSKNIAVVYLNKKEVDTDTFKKKIKYAEQGKIKE